MGVGAEDGDGVRSHNSMHRQEPRHMVGLTTDGDGGQRHIAWMILRVNHLASTQMADYLCCCATLRVTVRSRRRVTRCTRTTTPVTATTDAWVELVVRWRLVMGCEEEGGVGSLWDLLKAQPAGDRCLPAASRAATAAVDCQAQVLGVRRSRLHH